MREPTFAMRVLDRLAAGSMTMDVAVDLFSTHEFGRDENRRPDTSKWRGAFDDPDWSFGDAEFDAITRAYMRDQLSFEQLGAFTSAAIAPRAPEFQPTPPAEKLRWDRIVPWRTRLSHHHVDGVSPRWESGDGGMTTAQAELERISRGFVHLLDAEGVTAPFRWQRWMGVRGGELLADPVLLSRSSLEDGRRLLAAWSAGPSSSAGIVRAVREGDVDRVLQRIELLIGHR
jgi:hypothetical protein